MRFLLLLALFLLRASAPAQFVWEKMPDLPGAERDDATASSLGNMAIAGSGLATGWVYKKDFYLFRDGEWSAINDLPGTARQYALSFTADGYFWLFGGLDEYGSYCSDMYRYNTSDATWTSVSGPMPEGRSSACGFSVAEKGYLTGGKNAWKIFGDLWQFDPETESWKQATDYPGSPVWRHSVFTLEDNAYILFGKDAAGQLHRTVWEYNTINGQWSRMEDFPGPERFYATAGSAGGLGIAGGGTDASGNILTDFYAFHPREKKWFRLPDFPGIPRKGMSSFSWGNDFFLVFGIDSSGNRLKETWRLQTPELYASWFQPTLSPNPAADRIHLKEVPPGSAWHILDGKGVQVLSGQTEGYDQWINLSDLSPGIYFLYAFREGFGAATKFVVLRN